MYAILIYQKNLNVYAVVSFIMQAYNWTFWH
jgi:hypothetical protein